MKTTTVRLELGALCPPISTQLNGMLTREDAQHLDLDNEAITRCHIRGLIGDTETDRARRRLMKRVQKAVSARSGSNTD